MKMSLHKTTLKSIEKMIMIMNGEIKQLRTEFRKGQKDLFDKIRKLNEELTTKKKKVIVLEQESANCCLQECFLFK